MSCGGYDAYLIDARDGDVDSVEGYLVDGGDIDYTNHVSYVHNYFIYHLHHHYCRHHHLYQSCLPLHLHPRLPHHYQYHYQHCHHHQHHYNHQYHIHIYRIHHIHHHHKYNLIISVGWMYSFDDGMSNRSTRCGGISA